MQDSIGLPSAIVLAAMLWAAGAVTLANRDFVVTPNGNDYFDGGAGTDMIIYDGERVPISVDLSLGRAEGEGIESDLLVGFENVTGGRADDTIYGSAVDNVIHGMNGDDELFGAAGNDTLDGGRGDDLLGGGAGDDSYGMRPGDGFDHVFELPDAGAEDVLVIGFANRDAVALVRWQDALVVTAGSDETAILVVVWDQFLPAAGAGVERIVFQDGSLNMSMLKEGIHERPAFVCLLSWFSGECPVRPHPGFAQR